MFWLADSWLWDVPRGLWLLGYSATRVAGPGAQGKIHGSSSSFSPGPPEEVQLLGQRLVGFAGFLDLARGG